MIGAIPLDPPNYTIGVTGDGVDHVHQQRPGRRRGRRVRVGPRLQIATAKLMFQTNGYFEVDGNLDFDLDVPNTGVGQGVRRPAGEGVLRQLNGSLRSAAMTSPVANGIVSSKGVGACGKYLVLTVGFGYPWGGSPHADVRELRLRALQVQPVSAVPASVRAHAAAASVSDREGDGGRRVGGDRFRRRASVVLTDPQGQAVIPQTLSPATVPARPRSPPRSPRRTRP